MVAFLMAAIACGVLPVYACPASSPIVASLTWCTLFSMPQRPLHKRPSSFGPALVCIRR